MKKLNKLLLMGVVALGVGFTACNNDDIDSPNVDGQKGNTHVTIALKLGNNQSVGTRSLPNDYNYVGKWAGNDDITSITVFVSDAIEVVYKKYNVGSGEAYEMVNGVVTPKTVDAAIKTTPGWKEVYVLVNAKSQVEAYLGVTGPTGTLASSADFKTKYANVLSLANSVTFNGTDFDVQTSASKLAQIVNVAGTDKDDIMMTNVTSQTITVAPNITDTETLGGANRVSLEVERAVARVMVTTLQTTYNVPTPSGSSILGTVSDITWVLAQGENSLHVQRNTNPWEWATPNWNWVPGVSGADFETEAAAKYDYSGLYVNYDAATMYGGTTIPTLADYASAATDPTYKNFLDANALDGKFILPTTHVVNEADGPNSGYKKGNTAYVMVRAKFTPTTFADGTGYISGNDFWLGEDGKFYLNGTKAVDPDGDGTVDQKAFKYVGGKVIYYAWVNPDDPTGNWYNSPVLRNNIYHIHITGFKTIGTNWNPLFPEDPDNPESPEEGGNPDPKPGPDEPANPIDPEDPLTTPETYMSVDATVLDWLYHSYGVNLGI